MPLPFVHELAAQKLALLGPSPAVDLFRELLWAEADAMGIGRDLVDVPTEINMSDGGIDAAVDNRTRKAGRGVILPGFNAYQVKTGDFDPGLQASVNAVLFTPKSLKKGAVRELQPRVRACFKKGGRFALVLFGWDKPDVEEDALVAKIRVTLESVAPEFPTAGIAVWRANQLLGMLDSYPPLIARVAELQNEGFLSHAEWADQYEMRRALHLGAEQEVRIGGVRNVLRSAVEAVRIDVTGEPGIGKTRLVLEATRSEDLAPAVIYYPEPERFVNGTLLPALARSDSTLHGTVILDETTLETRVRVWDRLKGAGRRVRLITISTDAPRVAHDTVPAPTPPLPDSETAAIIQSYGTGKQESARWAELCGGSPRVAHVVGENLQLNPQDVLQSPSTTLLWERFITGRDDPKSRDVRERRAVLRHIALFRRFGFVGDVALEARAIARLVARVEPSVTEGRFAEIVDDLRERKILQGERTLYITPHLLHVWMWADFWKAYGLTFDVDVFTSELTPQLKAWFEEMFEYAAVSNIAAGQVRQLLAPDGPLARPEVLGSETGARFFRALAKADPKAGVRLLEHTVGRWDEDVVRHLAEGRQQLVWAVEGIAMWREQFIPAAGILLRLAETQPENSLVDASGAFSGLFVPAPAPVAATELPPLDRLPVLEDALESGVDRRQLLAVQACDAALETTRFARMIGAEYQGIRPPPQLWAPADSTSAGEIIDTYAAVWALLNRKLQDLLENPRREAVRVLLARTRGIGSIPALGPEVMETLRRLHAEKLAEPKALIDAVEGLIHYEGPHLSSDLLEQWEQLRDQLQGTGFGALMNRYVGMDLLEDKFDQEGQSVDKAQPYIEQLAEEALTDPQLLEGQFGWLLAGDAPSGLRFGYELGTRDTDLSLLPTLVDELRKLGPESNGFLMGGYFRALRERDEGRWETELDRIAADGDLARLIPELSLRSGLTDRAGRRLLALARAGLVPDHIFGLFSMGGLPRSLSPDTFNEWISYLLGRATQAAVSSALQLLFFYYVYAGGTQRLPRDLAMRVLAHEAHFGESGARDPMAEHYWRDTAARFLDTYPEASLELAPVVLDQMGAARGLASSFASPVFSVLNRAATYSPVGLWRLVAPLLGPPLDGRAFRLREWLKGMDSFRGRQAGALDRFPPEVVWEWVDENIGRRAWYVASFVPKRLQADEDGTAWAREVLLRYGNRADVRDNLSANFDTEGWTGSHAEHLRAKRDGLMKVLQQEKAVPVRNWLQEYVDRIAERIEQEETREERVW